MKRYLEPLRDEQLMCSDTLVELHQSISDITSFQRRFLSALQDAVDMEPGFLQNETQFGVGVEMAAYLLLYAFVCISQNLYYSRQAKRNMRYSIMNDVLF